MAKNTRAKRAGNGSGRGGRSDRRPSGHSGRSVHVKFLDTVNLPYNESVAKRLDESNIGPWRQLTQKFPGIRIRPMITVVTQERLRQLIDNAVRRDPTYKPANFFAYFLVDCPAAIAAEEVAIALSNWWSVEAAYVEPLIGLATVTPDDPFVGNQGYLNPAPDGINAYCAWQYQGGDGVGQNFVDLEFGWLLNHDDLIAKGAVLVDGVNTAVYFDHGTAVLGEICAVDNSIGCVGIVPNIATVGVVSAINNTGANPIMAAIDYLPFGGVLLIELQILGAAGISVGYVPFEVVQPYFDAIRLATALGITVVEAAGNGGNDLDVFTLFGNRVLDRTDPAFKDSGAIMVGAGSAAPGPHTRLGFSNFGNRFDCYAWGNSVYTLWATSSGSATNLYTASFNGTSSAAPIIAGAALAVQGIAQANLGYRFSGWQMRALLADPANGTASNAPATDRIGVMPDLCKITQSYAIAIGPDVYLRDFVGDIGDPHTGPISASPDIILLQSQDPTPQATFGPGPNANATLGGIAEFGQPNYIYVRVLNRGGSPANNVTATVYWSPPATLVTPSLWTLAGATTLPVVPAGNVLTVSNAIVWSSVPTTGHYCFVGLVGNAADPAPIPADFVDWAHYCRFISDNNNVTWRNFNVVNNIPRPRGPDGDYVAVEFLAPGADDQARWMKLEVVAKLPQGSRALLEIPLAMLEVMRERIECKIDSKRGVAVIPINPHGLRSLGDILFAPKSRAKTRLLVQIPKEYRNNAYDVFVRQVYERQEVGRITWRFAPPSGGKAVPATRRA